MDKGKWWENLKSSMIAQNIWSGRAHHATSLTEDKQLERLLLEHRELVIMQFWWMTPGSDMSVFLCFQRNSAHWADSSRGRRRYRSITSITSSTRSNSSRGNTACWAYGWSSQRWWLHGVHGAKSLLCRHLHYPWSVRYCSGLLFRVCQVCQGWFGLQCWGKESAELQRSSECNVFWLVLVRSGISLVNAALPWDCVLACVSVSCKILLSSLLSVFKSVTGIDTENDSFFHRQFRCDSGSK